MRVYKPNKNEYWYIQFKGIRRRIKAFTNKQASDRLKDKIQQLKNCKAVGLPLDGDTRRFFEQIPHRIRDKLIALGFLDGTAASKTLAEYIEIFGEYLTKKERDARHVKATILTLTHLFENCGFENWSDITADRLKAHLDELRDGGAGISKRTYNGKLKTAKHFCRWQARQLRTTSPIDFVEGLDNRQTDIRKERRAATPDEMRRLLERTAAGPERYRMSGQVRALLYRFAVETGFRAGEIRTLTKGCIDFDNLTVTVKAAYSKHRRQDVQAIRPELAAMLKEHCRGKLPAAIVFGGKLDRTAEMLKLDLKDAGIPYTDDSGRDFDFHALRHTFITSLRSVSSRTAQALARHGSSELTDSYTHIGLTDERSALDALPDYGQPSKESQKATGTDDKMLSKCCNSDAHTRTPADTSGKQKGDTKPQTPIGGQQQGCRSDSKSAAKNSKPLADKGLTKSDNIKVAEILFLDADLKAVVLAWPDMSEQAKHICKVLAEKVDD